MQYGRSRAEKDFKICSTVVISLILALALFHQVLKLMKYKSLNWNSVNSSQTIPLGIKLMLTLIEKEIAPALLCITFCVSTGASYIGVIVFTILIFINFIC